MSNKQLRWGILGCANIAKRAMIEAIQQSQTGTLIAIASRNEDTARETAEHRNIPLSYGSYDSLLDDPNIDAVYIPLPNSLHREWTIKAARAGKHVLCEKPIALNAAEAQEMADVCNAEGVKLAEAFMYRHQPRYALIQQTIKSGEIGELRGIRSTFTFDNSSSLKDYTYGIEMGAGSIYDVGVYPISAARMLFGAEPEAVTVQALFSEQHNYADMMASGLIEFPNSVALTFDCGHWASGRNEMEILGTKGRIEVPDAFVARNQNFVVIKNTSEEIEVSEVNQFMLQVDDFGRAILYGAPLKYDATDAIKNMRVIDACLKSAKSRIRITL